MNYWDKVFKACDMNVKKSTRREKKYCKGFEKGENGFCRHYLGCKIDIESCYNQCSYRGERI
ncbi:hypothetical protein HAHI6034_10980 [Hathewaya histolytica]|uniref:Uncharacterized protein n=1 Tax=Hathewaya histolytica TaxID=1498 RepID=A0A4V6KD14_HATHI|nr:hypothetical protein [Hathewaya histolytica]VTQ88617.1 Uncharacterised protein [Hathewaya histolytica]